MISGTRSVYFLYVVGSVILERAIQYAGIVRLVDVTARRRRPDYRTAGGTTGCFEQEVGGHSCQGIACSCRIKIGVLEEDGMPAPLTRRAFVPGAAIGSVSVFVQPLRAPAFAEGFGAPRRSSNEQGERRRADYTFTQFHDQTATSPLHRRLV